MIQAQHRIGEAGKRHAKHIEIGMLLTGVCAKLGHYTEFGYAFAIAGRRGAAFVQRVSKLTGRDLVPKKPSRKKKDK